MDRLDKIERFITLVDHVSDIDLIFAGLGEEVERLGYEWFNYTLFTHPERGAAFNRIHFTTYPDAWVRHYISQRYISNDAVFHHSRKAVRPFDWNSIAQVRPLTEKEQLILNEGVEAGLLGGGSIPIHGPALARATFSVGSSLGADKNAIHFLQTRHELQIIATYAHERLMQLEFFNLHTRVPSLSEREAEVLTWSAVGKSKAEIGCILSISEDTVKWHLKKCCAKLDVNNVSHAITRGILHGLITP